MCGRTMIHVYGAQNPGPGFETVTPTLEDVYFSTIYHATERSGA